MKQEIPGKFACTVTIGEKGQFVIPKKMRDMFSMHPGDTIIVLADVERGIAIPPKAMFNDLANLVFEPLKPTEQEVTK